VRAQPQSLADEQVSHRFVAQDLAVLRRVQQLSLQDECSSSSDEEAPADDEDSSSEDEEEEKENTPPNSGWDKHTHDIKLPAFTEPHGSTLPRNRHHSELGYLQFLTPELVSTMATNSNLYATSKGAAAGWATSAAELWRFISVHIFMGIVVLPSYKMYWEEGWRQQYVVEAFSRNRFKELLRYFHIAEPTPAGVKRTVIEKIRPLYDLCLQTFPDYFIPPREFTIDETMVRFKGRSGWITVIKGKPTPIGYKLYTVASHGYLLTFKVYEGKGGYRTRQGVIHHTVMELVKRWAHSNRILFMDNLYTSPHLCEHLLNIGIRSCGTTRPNRATLPPQIKKTMKSLEQDETKAWQRGQLGLLAWCDKKPILMLSTHHRVDDMVTVAQNLGPNHPPTVTKPTVSVDYNHHKCHVDTVDQLRQYYAMQRKSVKDWPSLAWWLIDICIINAYTLWCLDTNSSATQLDFRRALLQQIAAAYPIPHTREQPTVPSHDGRAGDGHWPKHTHRRRDCAYCSGGRLQRKKSNFVCERCDKYLCVDQCFKHYHVAQGIESGAH
jgi:Transposase IS4